jgi:trans-2,3-dihydro-3-hydroxyanthranilate isomerase
MAGTMRLWEFVHVDVFARRPLEGNPLAVFPDGRGLADSQMQGIAREMQLSETTFVLPSAEDSTAGHRARFFTVAEELPFAGHPTLGTAWVLAGKSRASEVRLRLKVGTVPVRFEDRDGRRFGEMIQPEPNWGRTHARGDVARALGVAERTLDPDVPIETVSTGNPFVIVAFRSLADLREYAPEPRKMSQYLASSDARYFYLVCRETEEAGARLHARMIATGGEDPATGSAAGPAAAWMVRHGWASPEESVWIEQGIEMKRPSQLYVRAGGTPDRPASIRVGGFCFPVIEGSLALAESKDAPTSA